MKRGGDCYLYKYIYTKFINGVLLTRRQEEVCQDLRDAVHPAAHVPEDVDERLIINHEEMGVCVYWIRGVVWFGPAAPTVMGPKHISNPDVGAIWKKRGAML